MITNFQDYARECKQFIMRIPVILLFCALSEGMIFGQTPSEGPWNRAEEGFIPCITSNYRIGEKRFFKGELEPAEDSAQNRLTLKQRLRLERGRYLSSGGAMVVKIVVYMQPDIWNELNSQDRLNKEITILAEVAEENGQRCLKLIDYIMGWDLNNLINPSKEKNEWEELKNLFDNYDKVNFIKTNHGDYKTTIERYLKLLTEERNLLSQTKLSNVSQERMRISYDLKQQRDKTMDDLWEELGKLGISDAERGYIRPSYSSLTLGDFGKCMEIFKKLQKLKLKKMGSSPTVSQTQPPDDPLWQKIQKLESSFDRLLNNTQQLPQKYRPNIYPTSDPMRVIRDFEESYYKKQESDLGFKIDEFESKLKTYFYNDLTAWLSDFPDQSKGIKDELIFPDLKEENLDLFVTKFITCYKKINDYYEKLKKQSDPSELKPQIDNPSKILDTSSQLSEETKKRVQELKNLLENNEVKEILQAHDNKCICSVLIKRLENISSDRDIQEIEKKIKKAIDEVLYNTCSNTDERDNLPTYMYRSLEDYLEEALKKYENLTSNKKKNKVEEEIAKLESYLEYQDIKTILKSDIRNKILNSVERSKHRLKNNEFEDAEDCMKQAMKAFKQGVLEELKYLTHYNIQLSKEKKEKRIRYLNEGKELECIPVTVEDLVNSPSQYQDKRVILKVAFGKIYEWHYYLAKSYGINRETHFNFSICSTSNPKSRLYYCFADRKKFSWLPSLKQGDMLKITGMVKLTKSGDEAILIMLDMERE